MDNETIQKFKELHEKLHREQAQNACPNCGYCPHCGRGGHYVYPYYYQPWYPNWPTITTPTITSTTGNLTISAT